MTRTNPSGPGPSMNWASCKRRKRALPGFRGALAGSGFSAVLAIFLIVSGCSHQPVRIGVLLELSGEASAYGLAIQKAVELAVERVNAEGGVGGHPVQVLYRDAASDRETALREARALVEQEHVPVIIGAATSTITLAVGRYCQNHRVILLSPAASNPQIAYIGDFVFRNFPSDRLEGRIMAMTMREKFHVDHVKVLYTANEYGQGLHGVFINEFRRLGGNVDEEFEYPPGTRDFSPILDRMAPLANADLYLIGYASDLVALISQIRERAEPRWLFTVSAVATPEALKVNGPAMEHVIFLQPYYDPDSDDPLIRRFVTEFRDRYGEIPDIYAAHGYDALMIIAQTMRLFGTRVEEIQLGLSRLHGFRGVAGLTTFNEDGDVLRFPRLYMIENHRFVPLDDARLKALRNWKLSQPSVPHGGRS